MPERLSPEEKRWILYDVGNSAYSLTISTTIYTIFFNTLGSQAGLSDQETTGAVGLINASAFTIIALLSPILGALADVKGKKKGLFLFFALLGALSVFCMILIREGQWLLAALMYNLATLGFAGSNIFYNSFLIDVSPMDRLDRVSASGFAWGYIGSTLPFLLSLGLIFLFFKDEQGISMMGFAVAFIITALWWILFTLPMALGVKQRYGVEPSPSPIKDSFKRLWTTLKKIRVHRQVFLFLIAYFLYIDGVDTIIVMSMDFGMKNSGFGELQLVMIILLIQFIAWPCTILYGRLAKKWGGKKVLYLGIGTYGLITLLAGLMESMPMGWINYAFVGIALLVGTAQGGIQALSRSYFGSIIPPEHSAEFFGFYNIFGKFAAIFGPLVIGAFSLSMGERLFRLGPLAFSGYSLGVLSLMVFFGAGGVLLAMNKPGRSNHA